MEGREAKTPAWRAPTQADGHRVDLRARAEAVVTGVQHVASFDDKQIVLGTELGTLTILGQDLQIRQLDLSQGSFRVEGRVDSLAYSQGHRGGRARNAAERGGLLGRLLR